MKADIRRVFLLVLDSVGIGALPDAAQFGDSGCCTLRSVSAHPDFDIPNLRALGIGNIPGAAYLGEEPNCRGAYGKMAEKSPGKDTTTGHWELAGVISRQPMPVFPHGFPRELLDAFSRACGRGVLCNRPYSGTEVIRDYGAEHLQTGKLIVYTSADSVFQIAAHTDKVDLTELYRCCEIARQMCVGQYGVGRVIARPFAGTAPDFYRTPDRRDFSLTPPCDTLLDLLQRAGRDVIGVGKIGDIFAARGLTASYPVHGNEACMQKTAKLQDTDFYGLCFVNLVDFDMLYGHRNDVGGYARALSAFDRWLGGFLEKMRREDVLIITADHGCDPGDCSTDHTREYVPVLVCGDAVVPHALGIRSCFADVGATVANWLGVPRPTAGESFADSCTDGEMKNV